MKKTFLKVVALALVLVFAFSPSVMAYNVTTIEHSIESYAEESNHITISLCSELLVCEIETDKVSISIGMLDCDDLVTIVESGVQIVLIPVMDNGIMLHEDTIEIYLQATDFFPEYVEHNLEDTVVPFSVNRWVRTSMTWHGAWPPSAIHVTLRYGAHTYEGFVPVVIPRIQIGISIWYLTGEGWIPRIT